MTDQATGSLFGGILGGIAGFFLGGNVALGYAIGSALGGRIGSSLAPPMQGPRLQDLAATSANYGASIPRIVGAMRVGGNLIWAGPLHEHSSTTRTGKGGGGPKVTSYTYTRSFAVALSEGEADVLRIWAAKKLIYDATSTDPTVIIAGKGYNQGQLATVYRGTETQTPDPTIEAYEGSPPPAYLGTCYIVINELDVTEFGGRLPPIEAEVVALPSGSTVSSQHLLGPYALPSWSWYYASALSQAWPACYAVSQGISKWVSLRNASDLLNPSVFYMAGADVISQRGPYPISQIDGSTQNTYMQLVAGSSYVIFKSQSDGQFYVTDLSAPNTVPQGPITPPTGSSGINYFAPGAAAKAGDYMFYVVGYSGPYWIFCAPAPEMIDGPQVAIGYMVSDAYSNAIGAGTLSNGEAVVFYADSSGTNLVLRDINFGLIYSGAFPAGMAPTTPADLTDGLLTFLDGNAKIRVFQWSGTAWVDYWTSGQTVPAGVVYAQPVVAMNTYICHQHVSAGAAYYVYTEDGISSSNPVTLADLITLLATEAPDITAADIDVTACTGIDIEGYARTSPSSGRDALSSALALYQVDCIESGGMLIFRPRSQAVTITVDPDDLGAHDFGAQDLPALTSTRTQDADLPRQINIHYLDPARDLQQTTQTVRRLGATEGNVVDLQYPGALTATEAKQLVDVYLRNAWRTRTARKFALPHTYLAAEPGDVLAWSGYSFRITRIDGSVPGPLTCQAVDQNPADYTSYATASVTGTQSSVSVPGPTDLLVLDIPALRDADAATPGVYLAACGLIAGWPGAAVERSGDGGASWSQIGVVGSPATIGITTTALPDNGINRVFDNKSTVTVRLYQGSLASVTELQALSGSNIFVIGNEVVTAQNAVLNADGTYTLSKLLRARAGTEDQTASHIVGERFVVVDSAGTGWLRQAESASLVGATLDYRGTTFGTYTSNADTESLSYTARSAKPFSPCHLKGSRVSSGDLTITWIRRTRYQTNWKSGYAPLGEASELYDLEILDNAGNVVRTVSNLTSATYTYSSTDQVADFGSAQSAVSIRIYQRSATVGRGIPASATL